MVSIRIRTFTYRINVFFGYECWIARIIRYQFTPLSVYYVIDWFWRHLSQSVSKGGSRDSEYFPKSPELRLELHLAKILNGTFFLGTVSIVYHSRSLRIGRAPLCSRELLVPRTLLAVKPQLRCLSIGLTAEEEHCTQHIFLLCVNVRCFRCFLSSLNTNQSEWTYT
jgi:hypothetical protein